MKPIKVRSKVAKFTGDRKIVEIPLAVRDEFKVGEKVYISKIEKKKRK